MDKGAHYYRCDFQVHTPRDRNWSGQEYITEEDRKLYAERFVKKCREIDLHAVAITDHHDTLFYKYIKEAASAETDKSGHNIPVKDQLIVFPGIEVSIATPSAQLLIIFDPIIDITLYRNVPLKLGITPSHDSEAKTCETLQLNLSVEDIIFRLNEVPDYVDHYIILPNVKPGGYKTFLRAGNHTLFSKLSCLGGYIEGVTYESLGVGNKNILEGRVPIWTKKAYGVFQTSDSRKDDLTTLGLYSSWVKWAVPSAEAIRQACLSNSCRISHIEPIVPDIYISKITVSNSKFLGYMELGLNKQFNALIGGRGTGKSTFLEYLRWGLCDPSFEELEDLGSRTFEKKRSDLIKNTLEDVDGSVTVEWIQGDVKHIVKRSSQSKLIDLTIGEHPSRQASLKDIRAIIGIQSYSQKELSTVGVDIDELRRFIESPIQSRLNEIHGSIEGLSAIVKQDFSRLREAVRIQSKLSGEKATFASIKEQCSTIRDQLKGLPEESLEIIKQNPVFEQESQILGSYIKQTTQMKDDILKVIENSDLISGTMSFPKDTINHSLLNDLKTSLTTELTQFSSALGVSINKLIGDEENSPDWMKIYDSWQEIYESQKTNYQAAKQQNLDYQVQLEALKKKEDQLNDISAGISKLSDDLAQLGTPRDRMVENISKIIELYDERRMMIFEQCEKLNTLSNGLINASLSSGGDLDHLLKITIGIFQGSGINADKIKRLIDILNNAENPFKEWHHIVGEIYSLWSTHLENETEFLIPNVPRLKKANLIDSELRRLASKMDSEKVISLMLYRFMEKPIFKYCASETNIINFDNASAGQQASALLKVLLSSDGPPLIIDQPEDDLDNEIVADISSDIWEAKKKRQIIFASHNANLVVNGDAELVVHFGYSSEGDQSSGKIKSIGSIDVPQIQDAIKTIMEGGERAFKLRIEKYGF
jgi:chromosome segregation protein